MGILNGLCGEERLRSKKGERGVELVCEWVEGRVWKGREGWWTCGKFSCIAEGLSC